ncbi:MAG: ABC transporter ATP-binding protein, partial [Armatimonadetes bacterium]|nr:ABC transporter ATP-binding protein [Armatimonadota bacterium]
MSTYFQEDEITGKAYDARLLRRLLRYLRPYRRSVLAAVALLLLASVSDLAGPYLFKVAIDRYIAAGQLAGLGRLAAVYLAVLLLHAVFRYAQSVLMQVVGQRAMYDLRMELFAHVERLSLSFFTRHPVGRLMTRLTNDVDALNELVTQGVVAIFGDFFMLAGIVVALLLLDWRLALVVFTVLPLLVGMAYGFQVRVRESYRAIRLRLARINAYLNEHIMGVAVMQLFNRERRAFARFDGLNRDHLEASLRAVRFYALFWPAVSVAEALAGALIIWYGGGEVVQKTLTLGTLV